jgi:hypothetical protein
MFQPGNYDKIEFNMSPQGMNQFISPEILPPQFSFLLENILPTPLGVGTVRYGTQEVTQTDNIDDSILEIFPFAKENGGKQEILYVQQYKLDTSVLNPIINNQQQFIFTTNNAIRYQKDTFVKVNYTLNGVNNTLYAKIQSVIINNNDVQITLAENFFPGGGVLQILNIYYPEGTLYSYDFDSETLTHLPISGLAVACIPRYAQFQQKLLICNGVDKVLVWDGNAIEEMVDFVKERYANTFNRIDNQHFSFVKINGFEQAKYFNNNLIELSVNGNISQLTLTNITVVNNLVTITTQEQVPVFTGQDRVEIFYRDWPPRFNYMFAGNDRWWALGEGPAGIEFRDKDQALRVYYPYEPNTLTNIFNENTKTVPSIDLSDKHGRQDNLEAICQINGFTAFIGRSKTQIWRGTIPGQDGDLSWSENIPLGIAHGNLLIEMPNDVYLVTNTGIQSASTLNIAKQLAATSENAVDPIVSQYLSDIAFTNDVYRACRSFKYDKGGFGGFKIGKNKILTSLFKTNFYAWSLFSGDFQSSNAFCDTGSGLHLAIGNKLVKYADGNDGSKKLYGDRNGTSIIPFVWIPGLVSKKKLTNKRFANKRYEIHLDYSSGFPLNPLNQVILAINAETPGTFEISDQCAFEETGDALGEIPLGESRLGKNYKIINKKLKFVAGSFWITLSGYAINGPIFFKTLILFGIGERNA